MKQHHKIIIHLLFWFYMLNQLLYPFYIGSVKDKDFWTGTLFTLALNVINFYLVYFALPFLMKIRFKPIAILFGIMLVVIISPLRFFVERFFWQLVVCDQEFLKSSSKEWFFNNLRLSFIMGIYALLIKFVIDWFDAQRMKAELQTQNKASELALLRSQVNPHFLFNTLNNIYSLVYKKSDEAPEAVMKLSSIMRYMLYDANSNQVPLEKEIEYLVSFIELQKLRTKEQDFLELFITGNPAGHTIAPMLLIPFVENAFKHGHKQGPLPWIRVRLQIDETRINFKVINNFKPSLTIQKDDVKGIGLHNIQRRLELLYPGRHSLNLTENETHFTIQLEITQP